MANLINKQDAPLHVDVHCYGCKKNCALSNTIEIDGRRYCERCALPLLPNIHDYLDQIGAKPPPIKGLVVMPVVETIEEALDIIEGHPGDPAEYGDSN